MAEPFKAKLASVQFFLKLIAPSHRLFLQRSNCFLFKLFSFQVWFFGSKQKINFFPTVSRSTLRELSHVILFCCSVSGQRLPWSMRVVVWQSKNDYIATQSGFMPINSTCLIFRFISYIYVANMRFSLSNNLKTVKNTIKSRLKLHFSTKW